MVKQVKVIGSAKDAQDLLMKIVDGSFVYKIDKDRSYYDELMLNPNLYPTIMKILNLDYLTNGEQADLMWLINHTEHGHSPEEFVGKIQTVGVNFNNPKNKGYLSPIRKIYDNIFPPSNSPGTLYTEISDSFVKNNYYKYIEVNPIHTFVFVFRAYYKGEDLNIEGPCQYLARNMTKGISNSIHLDKSNILEGIKTLEIAEPDANIGLEGVLMTILQSDIQGIYNPSKQPMSRGNYLQYTNKEIAAYFGLGRDYFKYMRDQNEYEKEISKLPLSNRFSMWDYYGTFGINAGDNVISYGTSGNWTPVYLDGIKYPEYLIYSPDPKMGKLSPSQIDELKTFLSNPINVRYGLSISGVMVELNKYSKPIKPSNKYSVDFDKLTEPQKEAILDFLTWSYVYVHVSKGLVNSGSYERKNMQKRLDEERETFNKIDKDLDIKSKNWLKTIKLIDADGKEIVLPGNINNLYDLASNHKICAVYKGMNMHYAAKLVLDSLVDTNQYSNTWMKNTKYRQKSEVYPLQGNLDYSKLP